MMIVNLRDGYLTSSYNNGLSERILKNINEQEIVMHVPWFKLIICGSVILISKVDVQ